jgi:hypothetical protein
VNEGKRKGRGVAPRQNPRGGSLLLYLGSPRLGRLVYLQERFWVRSCSGAYEELAERSHQVFSAMLIKLLYPLPRSSPEHALKRLS